MEKWIKSLNQLNNEVFELKRCNIPRLIKDNKRKIIRPRSWEMYSKMNVGKITIVGITFGLLMAKEIGKGIGKGKRH